MTEHDRKHGIGGSEVAAVLGLDPRKDAFAVWAMKTGQLTGEPPSPRMRLGKLFEQAILEYYSLVTERRIEYRDVLCSHPLRPWMLYTPDAVCLDEPRGVDAKRVGFDQKHRWGSTADDIPEPIQLQAVWYMAATGYPLWDIAALIGDDIHIFTLHRDEELEAEVILRVERFWIEHVLANVPPPIGASEASSRYLREAFPRMRAKCRFATTAERDLLLQYQAARTERIAAEKIETALENQIKLAIGDAEGIEWERGRFTWRNTKDSTVTDWQALATSLVQKLDADTTKALIEQFSKTKPGPRRIYFASSEEL